MAIAATTNESLDNSIAGANAKNGVNGNSASQDLNKNFLTLLVAQLKNQDPTNPMQNNELTTQLAQINTVSGIEKLNTTLGSISGQISGNQSIQASSLIGHGVMVPGKEILVGNDAGKVSTTPFGIELERTADAVTATISDATGKVVRTIDLGGLTAGVHSFSWDGSLEDGTNAPDGSYTVAINAKNGGEQLVAQPLRFAMVNGVTRGTDGAKLDLGVAGTSTLDDVRLILSKLGSSN
ncbi:MULTISPECIES: flagellar hook assembly protein FlgD [Serratia]|uniref:Basal-body rod modification protein FlgD n=1 Tax=Serratia fonticola TaxID=47917 RepID=A0AAP7K915_SERFO|nr:MULTISPECIES: flagellar hook assembly protein FlgD [Serratia]ERK12803.1 Flagellar basal-body rod modification protein FlgD [Serratia fonticola AU-AP2C]ATM78001.1 flagellar hook assembly protein FlgD [Serratia fonticola]MBC3213300.1 flagellar hook assembly protein FlgD [Serratia fonticola]MBC3219843.1 flagellar hook assembly protein FlgD [Serratia fonticola]MBP0997845.1 flagellar hook assembly protein FlgD [Serratia fonticola]